MIGHLATGTIVATSAVVSNQIGGMNRVGGLIGHGFQSTVSYSSALGKDIHGRGDQIGGLIGYIKDMRISHSLAFFDEIRGLDQVGGLIGICTSQSSLTQTIVGSLARFSLISGYKREINGVELGGLEVGGLIGSCHNAQIVSSMALGVAIVGDDSIGSLIGKADDITLASSYVVVSDIQGDSNTGGLVGSSTSVRIDDSYWTLLSRDLPLDAFVKSHLDLQSPTEFSGIYASWDDGVDLDLDDSVEDTTRWCDTNRDGVIGPDEQREDNFIWNLGRADEYPVLSCLPEISSRQRGPLPELFSDTDGDGDAIGNEKDNCPMIANFGQEDLDGDGYGDACDLDDDGDGYTDLDDNCPRDFNPSQRDLDGDDYADACELDFDGDGLIELATAAELDAVRYQLNGSGRRTGEDMPLSRVGCPVGGCNGYELISDINLTDYISGDEGWAPIGKDTNRAEEGCQGKGFNAVFDGNGRTISGLRIARPAEDCVGLFGHIEDGEVHNLEVKATHITGKAKVGILAGFATRATVRTTNASSATLKGEGNHVGGLIGHLSTGTIVSSSAVVNDQLVGKDQVGGLIGRNFQSTISYSSALSNDIRGENQVGGLIGYSWDMRISSSMAVFNSLYGESQLGGFIGRCDHFDLAAQTIIGSLAHFSLISGSRELGGLIGACSSAQIVSSMALGVDLVGDDRIGGLIGAAGDITLASSYAVVPDIQGNSKTKGLVGFSTSLSIDDSYWTLLSRDLPLDAFAKSYLDLQSPTSFSGIYASWDDGADLDFDDSVEDTTRWCDTNRDGVIGPDEQRGDNFIWDLGRSDEYPALSCLPEISSRQRELLPELFDDTDGDGIADAFDVGDFNGRPCSEQADCDGDGTNDNQDAFPLDPNEQLETDGDAIGDNGDNCPFVFNPDQRDMDGDGEGDVCDADPDGDGFFGGGDNCPLVSNPTQQDSDLDAHGDACDLDGDGDGLIEITTAAELDAVRYQLNASGRRLSQDGPLNTVGCGDGREMLDCDGYELAADIDLAAYANRDEGKGWQPLGHDHDRGAPGCQGDSFATIFEGNGFTIHNLHIARTVEDCVGLFGQVEGELRNLTLANADVTGDDRVGILAGEVDGASITIITINSSRIHGDDYVGGLVGKLSDTTVEAVFVAANLSGDEYVGGVIGRSDDSSLSHVSFTGDKVDGRLDYIGGLMGWAEKTTIMDSIVLGAQVSGKDDVGGAVGRSVRTNILGSAALTSQVIGSGYDVGGLIGEAGVVTLAMSAAFSGEISGRNQLGGLFGRGEAVRMFASLAVSHQIAVSHQDTGIESFIGGLVGFVRGFNRYHSYWDSIAGLSSDRDRRTTGQLQSPTDHNGVYVNWNTAIDFDNADRDGKADTGTDDNTLWCDTNYDGEIDDNEETNTNYIWDFGTSTDYPTLRCTPISPQQQRAFINSLGD